MSADRTCRFFNAHVVAKLENERKFWDKVREQTGYRTICYSEIIALEKLK